MQYNFSNTKVDMKKIEDRLSKDYGQVHTGRASPAILDGITVETYGAYQPLKNLASISIEDPKTLRIVPWDKTQIKAIEKGIISSNLGLSPAVDDAGIRVIFPQLTEESRLSLVKVLKEKLEEFRIAVRRERERVWDDIQKREKDGLLNEDEKFRSKDDLQKIVDETNRNLEAIFEKKEREVMG